MWVRSSPTLGIEWLSALAQALEWLTGPTRWREVGQNLWRGVQNNVLPALVGAVLLAGLLYQRRALVWRLAEGVDAIGDVRRDSFGRTARALGVTLLLSLPWPCLLYTSPARREESAIPPVSRAAGQRLLLEAARRGRYPRYPTPRRGVRPPP